MNIQEKPIVETAAIVTGLVITEKFFDQIPRVPVTEQNLMWDQTEAFVNEHAYAWVGYYPKGSDHVAHYVVCLKAGQLYKTGLVSEVVLGRVQREFPQLYIK